MDYELDCSYEYELEHEPIPYVNLGKKKKKHQQATSSQFCLISYIINNSNNPQNFTQYNYWIYINFIKVLYH